MKQPEVSIIVVNFNGKRYLFRCIASILKNEYKNYEIIVVDNGSSDGSILTIKDRFADHLKNIKFVELEKNYGPAKARNEGAKIARGKYLGFLDNDTQVDKNWISEAVRLFNKDKKIGCLQCKLLLLKGKNRFDYAGEYINQYGFLTQRAKYGELDKGQYDQEVEILAAKSAGMFIRKDVFNKIGGFDNDYFIYVEETDLGWRSWLAGYKTVFCPRSVVYHEFGTSLKVLSPKKSNLNVRFHGTKNYIMTLIKNLSFPKLVFILPFHIFIWFCFAFFLMIRGSFRSAFNVLKGIGWNITNFSTTISKRKRIQAVRVVSDNYLFPIIMRKQSILKKIKQFFLAEKEVPTAEST